MVAGPGSRRLPAVFMALVILGAVLAVLPANALPEAPSSPGGGFFDPGWGSVLDGLSFISGFLGNPGGDGPGVEVPESLDLDVDLDAEPGLLPTGENPSSMSLVELASRIAGVAPDSREAHDLELQLRTLNHLPPAYEAITRVTLEGMVTAMDLQEHALRDLTPQEKRLVREADPDASLSPELKTALAKVDQQSVAQAMVALLATSDEVLRIIDAHKNHEGGPVGAAEAALRKELEIDERLGVPVSRSTSPGLVAADLAGVVGLDPQETALVAKHLEGLPKEVREAVGTLAAGLLPMKTGAGPDTPQDMVRLGAAVDATKPVLETWSAQVLAAQIFPASPEPPWTAFPDPDGPLPPLQWGTREWTDGVLPPLDADPGETGRALAGLFLEDERLIAQAGQEIERVINGLPEDQGEAVLRVLDAIRVYIERHQSASKAQLPSDVDVTDLVRWSAMVEDGRMLEPGSTDAERLQRAVSWLQEQRRATVSAERLLQAVEELVPTFTASQSSSDGSPGLPEDDDGPSLHHPASGHGELVPDDAPVPDLPCEEDTQVLFILAIDTCGVDSQWDSDVMLRIDVGGDDTYTSRLGAPFEFDPGVPSVEPVAIPVAINLDLGGSDTYITAEECAQGAGCPDHPVANLDPTAVSSLAPVGILVDWNGDGADVENTFQAGNRSQGFYAPTVEIPDLTLPDGLARFFLANNGVGVLVERVGEGSRMTSIYVAGDRSQGSAMGSGTPGISEQVEHHGGRGLLMRLVGSSSTSFGTFEAGKGSQGSSSRGYLGWHESVSLTSPLPQEAIYSLGGLLNLAGRDVVAEDRFKAGEFSQGAILSDDSGESIGSPDRLAMADAIFANIVGPGSERESEYELTRGPGRGYLDQEVPLLEGSDLKLPRRALFIDAAVPGTVDVEPGLVWDSRNGTIQSEPRLGAMAWANSTYRGLIVPGEGYGWSWNLANNVVGGGFYDIGGHNEYDLAEEWANVPPQDRPRNNGAWGDGIAPHGVDASFEADASGYPSALNEMWPFWNGKPEAGGDGIAPLGVYLSLDRHHDVTRDRPHALVLTAGGDNRFLRGYSATVHIDLTGNDIHEGRAGAAGGIDMGLETTDGETQLTNRLLSFHLDLSGDDSYDSDLSRNQGYAEAGAIGILMDLRGNDRFVAPERAQGVAMLGPQGTDAGLVDAQPSFAAGVLVALRDLDPGAEDRNWFEVEDNSRSQGYNDGPGRVGVLVAAGSQNTFSDGLTAEDGNLTANLGENEPPVIKSESFEVYRVKEEGDIVPAFFPLQPGKEYEFRVDVGDEDGSPVQVCWIFEHGDPTTHGDLASSRECAWYGDDWETERTAVGRFNWDRGIPFGMVHTDAKSDGIAELVNYNVHVETTDSGGMSDNHVFEDITVRNPPPVLLDRVQGETQVTQNEPVAYQVPFLREDDTLQPTFEVDWGDGSHVNVSRGDAVNWALAQWGTTIHVPDRVSRVTDGIQSPIEIHPDHPPANVLDGNPQTSAEFRFNPSEYPLIHFLVKFPSPRHIGNISLDAVASPGAEFDFSVEGIDPEGRMSPFGTVHVDDCDPDGEVEGDNPPCPDNRAEGLAVSLPERPFLSGIMFRQILPEDPDDVTDRIRIQGVHAMGPGAIHDWPRAGAFNMSYSVIDEFGGRNTTHLDVHVLGDTNEVDETLGGIAGIPELQLVDIADRGTVRHASVGFQPVVEDAPGDGPDPRDRPLRLISTTDAGVDDGECVTDDDGNRTGGVCAVIDWGDGSLVERVDIPPRGDSIEVFHRWNTAGTWEITVSYEAPGGVVGPEAVATAHVEEALDIRLDTGEDANPILFITLDNRTTWHTGIPHHAIIDGGGGDNRYFGTVAAPRNNVPSLLVDAGGDDDYLSRDSGSQGYGSFATVGVLVDAGGDDRFVVPGRGQGAGERGGAGALLSLGGSDMWNPVPHNHHALDERFPDRFESGPDQARPEALQTSRPSLLRAEPELVQGAADDGIGIFVATGGMDIMVAGDRSQGFGMHRADVEDVRDYFLPDPRCFGPDDVDLGGVVDGDVDMDIDTLNQLLCLVGIRIPDDEGEYSLFPDPEICDSGAGPCLPDTTGLSGFLADGPRYGPGLGMFMRGEGPSGMWAGSGSQASSLEAGRGVLIDLDGGSVYGARDQSQAYVRAGASALIVGGPHATWLGEKGQFYREQWDGERNPEGLVVEDLPDMSPVEALLYFGGPRDSRCERCDPTTPPPMGLDGGDSEEFSILAPELSWGAGFESGGFFQHTEPSLELTVNVDAAGVGLDSFETVMMATVHTFADGNECSGEPIAGPIVLDGLDWTEEGSFGTTLDLTEQAYDGSLYPAGCYRIHAFARHAAERGIPMSDWGMESLEVMALVPPPARLDLEGSREEIPRLVEWGEPFTVNVLIPEPRARFVDPHVDLFVTDLDENDLGWDVTPGSGWAGIERIMSDEVGAVRGFIIDPQSGSTELAPGEYRLKAVTSWSGSWTDESSILLADLFIHLGHPEVSLDDPDHMVFTGSSPIQLTGTATDPEMDPDGLIIRLVRNETSCLSDPDPSGSCVVAEPQQASLTRPDDAGQEIHAWSVSLEVVQENDFRGGEAVVQATATNLAGVTSGWRGLNGTGLGETFAEGKVLLIDRFGPEIIQDISIAGVVGATNATYDIQFELALRDCAADTEFTPGQCVSGSGVAPEHITAFVRDRTRGGPMKALDLDHVERDLTLDPDGNHFVARFNWSDGNDLEGPPQGTYEAVIQVQDQVGNMLIQNPGVVFIVDRSEPRFQGEPEFNLPEHQTAVKPGDSVTTTARVQDEGSPPSGVIQVTTSVGGHDTELDLIQDLGGHTYVFQGTTNIPDGLETDSIGDDGMPIRILVEAMDAAHNKVETWSQKYTFFERPPLVEDIDSVTRSDTIDLTWSTSRATMFDRAVIVQQSGPAAGTEVEGHVESDAEGARHGIRFEGLEPETVYALDIVMRDAAGHLVDLGTVEEAVAELATLHRADARIQLDGLDPQVTYSGEITVTAAIQDAVQSTVALHDESRSNPVLAQSVVGEQQIGQDLALELTFDSRQLVDTLDAARVVDLTVVMDDGVTFWEHTLPVRIDNAPPQAVPFVEGPEPHMGDWYNASVIVHANAADDTLPIQHEAFVNGEGPIENDHVKIEEDGEHVVRFVLEDAAVPPNRNVDVEHTVIVDTRPPELEANVSDNQSAVRELNVPLDIAAAKPDDPTRPVAPLDGIRVRLNDGPWTPWSMVPPENVTLPDGPDGHHWIHVEARDAVHNAARESIPVLLDRTPPEILALSWIGTTKDGEYVLEYIVHDRLEGEGQPAGVVALRHGGPDAPWITSDGVGSLNLSAVQVEAGHDVAFMDAAGNTVSASLPPLPEGPEEFTDDEAAPPRRADLLRDARVLPQVGHAGEPFTFSVIVLPRDGHPPDSVWLEVAGMRLQMRTDSAVLEDGGRLFTLTVELPASQLDAGHTHRFEAVYAGETVATPTFPGPLVTRLGAESLQESDLDERGVPAPPVIPLVLMILSALAIAMRRRNDR